MRVLECLSEKERFHDIAQLVIPHVSHSREPARNFRRRQQRGGELAPDVQEHRVARRLVQVHGGFDELRAESVGFVSIAGHWFCQLVVGEIEALWDEAEALPEREEAFEA